MRLTRPAGWIGVDVGTHAVKLAQLERRGARLVLREAVVVERSEPWPATFDPGAPPRESAEELVAARSLGESFSGQDAAATIPLAACQLHMLALDPGRPAQQREAITRQLAALAAVKTSDRQFDYWSTENSLEQRPPRENSCVISTASAWTTRIARDHASARLACHLLDGLPLALARAVRMAAGPGQHGPLAALDWGAAQATFCIVVNGRAVFVRTLREGGFAAISAALCERLAISPREAQEIARTHGLPPLTPGRQASEAQRVIADVTADALAGFTAELQRTLSYLRSQRNALQPTRMYLFGGGATLRNVDRHLAKITGLKTTPWDLGTSSFVSPSAGECPLALLGPAIALSELAWMKP